jgi:hypothetical protein
MKIRSLIVAAASVAVLTAAIAAPVAAGGPASYKVASRGVSYGIETIATNCPEQVVNPLALKQMGDAGRIIGQQDQMYPCMLLDSGSTRTPAQRDAVVKAKSRIKAEAAQVDPYVDYYIVLSYTSGAVAGQAGSGYDWTGIGAWAPVTEYIIIAWLWDWTYGGWNLVETANAVLADDLVVLEDLAGGAASTYIPGIGWYDVGCIATGAWGRDSETITGGLDPNDGWTYDLSRRTRWCVSEVSIGGTTIYELPYGGPSLLDRTLFQTVDVYPY